ncbi:pollen receptor-like kinase 3 [Silene latifolia]|uniref:pollen receptor-like kinase 3 n=1 Tax=Silene latifolia TaxID=37657 RepID=UPI003D789ACA
MSAVRFLLLLLCLSLSLPKLLSLTEAEALLAIKKSMLNTGKLSSWKENSKPCEDKWEGVFCEAGKPVVIRLHLQNMDLSGVVDVNALTQIKNLKTLSLSNNSFSGPLPSVNKLAGLRALYVSANKFSGEIPVDHFAGASLRRVWLSDNQFSGKIPESLGKLPSLTALHLEGNQFSGSIPDISQPSLTELDMSRNQLVGEVPASMVRFGADAFKGNAGVCGKLVGIDCEANKEPVTGGNIKNTVGVMIGVVVVMLILLLLTTGLKSKNKENDFRVLSKTSIDEEDVVEVRVHGNGGKGGGGSTRSVGSQGGGDGGGSVGGGSSKKSGENSSHKNGSRKGSQHGKTSNNSGMGDLIVINNEKGSFGLADLMKAAAEVLGNGGLGSAYKAVMANGLSVVVKRIRDMNKLDKEEFDVAIRHIGNLRHKNILTPLAYHYRKEEKLVISEHVPKGSLLYVMHGDRGTCHSDLNWPTRLKIIKGIASGVQYIHAQFSSYDIPHGNLKSSNVLLTDTYEPLLSDYAFIKMVSVNQASQGMFAYKSPEGIESQQVSHKSDIYCLGIIILEVLTGKFPSQYLNAGKGGTDVIQWVQSAIGDKKEAESLDPEIVSSYGDSVPSMIELLHLGAACTESDPSRRPSLEDVLKRIEQIKG